MQAHFPPGMIFVKLKIKHKNSVLPDLHLVGGGRKRLRKWQNANSFSFLARAETFCAPSGEIMRMRTIPMLEAHLASSTHGE